MRSPSSSSVSTDAAAGLVLSTEARWNQNEADWRFFLSDGIVFGVRDDGGRLIATAALLPYSAGNAWISMVLVTESWRRRGIATQARRYLPDTARRMNLTSWLDATPAGAKVYGPLGFTPTLQLRRLRLAKSGRSASHATARALRSGRLRSARSPRHRLCARSRFSRNLPAAPARAWCRMARPWHWSATDAPRDTSARCLPIRPDQALALVEAIVASESGPLLLDAVTFADGIS